MNKLVTSYLIKQVHHQRETPKKTLLAKSIVSNQTKIISLTFKLFYFYFLSRSLVLIDSQFDSKGNILYTKMPLHNEYWIEFDSANRSAIIQVLATNNNMQAIPNIFLPAAHVILSSSEIHNIYHVVHKAPDYLLFRYHITYVMIPGLARREFQRKLL